MKKNFLSLIAIFMLSIASTPIAAQIKVAILEPIVETGQVSAIYKSVLRSKLVSSISNEEVNYEAFTRSDIDAIMREQRFQNNEILDDDMRIRLGNLGGVDCICVSKLAEGSGYINIDIMLINVKSGKIESVANKLISNYLNELEQAAIELGRKLVGLDRVEQQRKEAEERQRQLELQREREQEMKRQQEIEAKRRQEQLEVQERIYQLELQRKREEEERLKQERAAQQKQQQIDDLNSAIENLGSAISGAIQTANSYSIIFCNTHSSPRKITINGEIIGFVDGYSTKSFLVPIRLQGILQSTQTKDYLFSPNIERFEIKGMRKGQTIKLKN